MKRKMRMAPRTYKIENRKGRNWTVTHRVEPARITMAERLRDHCDRHPDDRQAWAVFEKIMNVAHGLPAINNTRRGLE